MKENCLILNPKKGKTEFVIFATRKSAQQPAKIVIDNNIINQPDSYEYLGIKLDDHLNMISHYQSVYKRISSRINLLRKIRHKISPGIAETIFKSMIHPLFFYCYPVYSGMSYTWLQKFESLQNRAEMIINNSNCKKWATIDIQRTRKIAVDVFKAINGITEHNRYELVSHSINTRSNNSKLKIPKIRTEAGRKSSYYQGVLVFNRLDSATRQEKCLIRFKNMIRNYEF